MIQLPNDTVSVGYRETRPYHFEQVFSSAATRFTGTEREFLAAGHAYQYVQLDQFTRRVVA